jgi:SNF2 family DNA or RNA helicase
MYTFPRLQEILDSDQEQIHVLEKCKIKTSPFSINLLRDVIEAEIARLKNTRCAQRSFKKPHDFQINIAKFLIDHRGLIVFHTVGSGKTLTAIVASQCYLDKFPNHNVIVITPAGLLNNFKKEMETSYGNIIKGSNYHFFSFEKFTNLSKKGNAISCKNSLLIIDEVHNLKTAYHKSATTGKEKGIRTKEIIACAEKAHRVLVLTGTPIYNSKNDVITLYNMIRNPTHEFQHPKTFDYRLLHCKVSFHEPGSDPNFPGRQNHDVYIDMSRTFLKKYNDTLESIVSADQVDELTKIKYGDDPMRLKAFHNAVRRAVNNLEDENSTKIQWLVNEIIAHPNDKSIVFSHFIDAGNKILFRLLTKKGIRVSYIHGQIPMTERNKIVADYNQDKIQVLLISKAGGEGLDLKETRRVFLLEPTWNQASQEQVIGRAIRYKSHANPKDVVNVFYLYHIKPQDRLELNKIAAFLKQDNEDKKIPLNPYENSIDLYLKVFIQHKQIILNDYIALLKKCSIESNKCY